MKSINLFVLALALTHCGKKSESATESLYLEKDPKNIDGSNRLMYLQNGFVFVVLCADDTETNCTGAKQSAPFVPAQKLVFDSIAKDAAHYLEMRATVIQEMLQRDATLSSLQRRWLDVTNAFPNLQATVKACLNSLRYADQHLTEDDSAKVEAKELYDAALTAWQLDPNEDTLKLKEEASGRLAGAQAQYNYSLANYHRSTADVVQAEKAVADRKADSDEINKLYDERVALLRAQPTDSRVALVDNYRKQLAIVAGEEEAVEEWLRSQVVTRRATLTPAQKEYVQRMVCAVNRRVCNFAEVGRVM